jgi:hypothetical protein
MSNKDEGGLLGLFSTRSGRPALPAEIEPHSEGTGTVTGTGGTVGLGKSATGTRAGSAPHNSSKGELSPLGNLVMREARRELGSNVDMQRSQAGSGRCSASKKG